MDVASSEFKVGENQYDLDFKTANNDKSKVISGMSRCFAHFEIKSLSSNQFSFGYA